jgi:hypothetical protein
LKYVSVLTPPLLVCAVFLIAVVAFLRHEMGGRRRGSEEHPPEEISGEEPIPGRDPDTSAPGDRTNQVHDDK